MSDQAKRLTELLAYHGSDISRWPKQDRLFGEQAGRRPQLAALIEAEKRFEQLAQRRSVPSVSHDLAARIITASFLHPHTAKAWISEVLAEVRPAAFAAMLMLGFAIGFGMMPPAHMQGSSIVQSTPDDEGAIL